MLLLSFEGAGEGRRAGEGVGATDVGSERFVIKDVSPCPAACLEMAPATTCLVRPATHNEDKLCTADIAKCS